MEHFYTYPTVTPLPRDRSRGAREFDPERRMARPGSERSMTGRPRPESYASTSSGGILST